MREGFRIVFSRGFWRAYRHYWSGSEISHRIDLWVARFREGTGQKPDLEVQRRINEYRKEKASTTGTERDK